MRTNLTNAFRLRKATYLNQAAGARSTEGLHVIAAKRRMESAQRAAWNHREAVHVITANGGVLTAAVY